MKANRQQSNQGLFIGREMAPSPRQADEPKTGAAARNRHDEPLGPSVIAQALEYLSAGGRKLSVGPQLRPCERPLTVSQGRNHRIVLN